MSGMEPMLIAAMVGTGVSTIMQAQAQSEAGKSANQAAQFRARQLEQQAGQERAASQRASIEARRRAALMASRAQALAASSGAGALDPSVINIMSGITGEGELSARTALYQGEERAIGSETGAATSRYEGLQSERAGKIRSAATILGGASSMYGLSRHAAGPSPTQSIDQVKQSYVRQFGEF